MQHKPCTYAIYFSLKPTMETAYVGQYKHVRYHIHIYNLNLVGQLGVGSECQWLRVYWVNVCTQYMQINTCIDHSLHAMALFECLQAIAILPSHEFVDMNCFETIILSSNLQPWPCTSAFSLQHLQGYHNYCVSVNYSDMSQQRFRACTQCDSDVHVAKKHCGCGCWQKQHGRPKGTTRGEMCMVVEGGGLPQKRVWSRNHQGETCSIYHCTTRQ